MKKQKILRITQIALLFLTVLFVILSRVWQNLTIVSFIFAFALVCLSIINAIFALKQTKTELRQEYGLYLLEKYNNHTITKQQLESQDESFYQEYLKENRWEILRCWVFIAILTVILVAIIFSIIYNLTI